MLPQRLPAVIVILLPLLLGCAEDHHPILYSDDFAGGPPPAISSISSPTGNYLAGVTQMTMTGTHFSATPANNYIYFDTTRANVLNATTTSLIVQVPYFPIKKDSVRHTLIRATVLGAQTFDSTWCDLKAAAIKFPAVDASEEAWSLASDGAGLMYAAVYDSVKNTSTIVRYSLGLGTRDSIVRNQVGRRFPCMQVSNDGFLYFLLEGTAVLLRAPLSGGTPALYLALTGMAEPKGFDFDVNHNIWIISGASAATKLGRITSTKAYRTFNFPLGSAKAVRVFGNDLYVSVSNDTMDAVWKAAIVSADSLGTFQVYFDMKTKYSNRVSALAIDFSADQWMYLGLDNRSSDGILLVAPGGTAASVLYAPLIKFNAPVSSFAWGTGSDLYAARRIGKPNSWIYYINTEKTGAPYYSR